MEGKEVRFGIANSALYAVVTTDASCGAVNSMHDSFTPIGGLVPMSEQEESLRHALAAYQGQQVRRDDLTVLGFVPHA